jgi:rare lipoprotein A
MLLVSSVSAQSAPSAPVGTASWYGEAHRGKLMANGKQFNPDKLTAASWFYPLETKLIVTLEVVNQPSKTVVVTVTDRGPAISLVNKGRIIDLSRAAFEKLAPPTRGLILVRVRPESRGHQDPALASAVPCETRVPAPRGLICGEPAPQVDNTSLVEATVTKQQKTLSKDKIF